jgi:hypothetical protein
VKKCQQNAISGTEGKQSLIEITEIKPALKKEKEIYKNLQSELIRKEKALA